MVATVELTITLLLCYPLKYRGISFRHDLLYLINILHIIELFLHPRDNVDLSRRPL